MPPSFASSYTPIDKAGSDVSIYSFSVKYFIFYY